jgi:hypothetical protein
MNRGALYVLCNLAVILAVLVGYGEHKEAAHPIYVILLFALCSAPILESLSLKGPYALLLFWSAFYFVTYGALDLQRLLLGVDQPILLEDEILSKTEAVILLGAVLVQVSYRIACSRVVESRSNRPIKDWSEGTLVVVGLIMWAGSSRLCWEFSTQLLVEKTTSATMKGLESIGSLGVVAFMIARLLQPVSIMIIAYAQCRYRRTFLIPIVLALVLYQLFFGFVIDTKGEAMTGGIIVIVTNAMVRGRLPKAWLALMALLVVLTFPILQANRVVRDENNVNARKASQDIAKIFHQAVEAQKRVNEGRERAQTLLERTTTKSSVELIVNGIDSGHPYMHGYTLMPLFTAFLPRLIWGDKPSIPTGELLNQEYHVSSGRDTYISPSHVGELYWNFGWIGLIVGMGAIGLLLGTVGAKCDLSEAPTITRLLIAVVTVRQLIVGSEGEFAVQYVVWMRAIAGIWLMHLVFARVSWNAGSSSAIEPQPSSVLPPPVLFPNLLR